MNKKEIQEKLLNKMDIFQKFLILIITTFSRILWIQFNFDKFLPPAYRTSCAHKSNTPTDTRAKFLHSGNSRSRHGRRFTIWMHLYPIILYFKFLMVRHWKTHKNTTIL